MVGFSTTATFPSLEQPIHHQPHPDDDDDDSSTRKGDAYILDDDEDEDDRVVVMDRGSAAAADDNDRNVVAVISNAIVDVVDEVTVDDDSGGDNHLRGGDEEDDDDDDEEVVANRTTSTIAETTTTTTTTLLNQMVVRETSTPSPSNIPPTTMIDCCSDDESGNIMERDYTGMFEGPEKTLEVVFRRIGDNSHTNMNLIDEWNVTTAGNSVSVSSGCVSSVNCTTRIGLRQLSRTDVDRICDRARCTILSSISNRYLDAYVLSESSLFIYPYMLVLKTCGTTTLLRCIATLIDLGRKLGLEIDWVGYSRKNFNFPGDQAFPHQSFHQELDYLYSHRILSERLDGNGYTLGPVNGDHWFVFVADHTSRTGALEIDTDRVLNIMMFDIDENVAKFFYYDEYDRNVPHESKDDEVTRISNEQTVESGIKDLCPGAIIDPRAFEPCGYSMNAVLFRSYSTIHITPESGSSYASFETNQKVGSYKALISNVIRTFRPKRFVMTLMADEGGLKQVKDNPLADAAIDSKIVVPATKAPESGSALRLASFTKQSFTYKRSSLASIKVEDDCCCMMGNWVLEKSHPTGSHGNGSSTCDRRGVKARGMTIS
jgi:S-adenosylmethionine decarboxylase